MRSLVPRLSPFALLRWSFAASRAEFARLAAALACVWVCELAIPFLLGRTVDAAITGRSGSWAILALGGTTLGLTVVLYAVHAAYLRRETRIVARATLKLRKYIYRRILEQPPDFFAAIKTGEISHRIMIDSDVIDRNGIYLFADLPFAAFTVLGIFAVMLAVQPMLALLVFATLTIAAALSYYVGRPLDSMESVAKARWATLGGALHDIFDGIRTVKVFRQERRETLRLDSAARALADAEENTGRTVAKLEPLLELVNTWGFLAVVWYGAFLVYGHALTAGGLVAFVAYMERMSEPLRDAGLYVRHYRQAKASLKRVVEFLASLAPPLSRGAHWADGAPEIEIANARVRYPHRETDALGGVSLRAKPGEIVAVVGHNGAGKTTLGDVILGLREPDEGHVCIGGVDVRDWHPEALQGVVAAVPQDVFLFHASLEDNISYGFPDASRADVMEAAHAVGLGDLIARLPCGLETIVGDRGCALSGGERQRVALARVALLRPRILVLDEPDTSLDAVAHNLFERILDAGRDERIAIVVTHDKRTLARADRVVVLDKGRLVFSGTQSEWQRSESSKGRILVGELATSDGD
jgi:ABC-type multidrug transport system fused ATPase/permease subunit